MKRKLLISLAAVVLSLAILYVIHMSSCSLSKSKTLFINALENNAECSALKLKFNCTLCQPLSSYYVMSANRYLTSDVKIIFANGSHCLHVPPNNYGENVVNLTGVSN